MTRKELHNSITFNCFVLRVHTICLSEYHTFNTSRFPKVTMRNIEKCYKEGVEVEETALYINTH